MLNKRMLIKWAKLITVNTPSYWKIRAGVSCNPYRSHLFGRSQNTRATGSTVVAVDPEATARVSKKEHVERSTVRGVSCSGYNIG